MSKSPTKYLPDPSDLEVLQWVKKLQEAEKHLREKLGDKFDAVMGPGGQTFLLQDAQNKLIDDITETRRTAAALLKSEAMMREAQRIARFGSWEFDLTNLEDVNSNPLRWSDEVFHIFGYKPGEIEVSSENFFRAAHPDDHEVIEKAVEKAIRENVSYAIDHRIILPDGTIRFVHEEGQVVKDLLSGKPLKMVGIVQDITEQKEKEEALRLSDEHFSSAFERAPIGMALLAPDGRWLKVNRAICALTGYTAEELFQLTFQDITHPDDLEADLDNVAKLLAGEIQFYQMEKRYFHKLGQVVWVQLSVSLVRDSSGQPVHFISQIQDITERRAYERRLAEQAALLDQARDAIILRDMNDEILFWNKGAERIYGWTPSEVIGKKATTIFYVSLAKFNLAMESVLKNGAWIGELEHVTKLGVAVEVESRWTLLRDEAGRSKAVLCINTDITERKKMESHFLRAQRMESIGTLAGGIAHDLNNLLAPIIMGVDLLKHFGLEGASLKIVEDIERSAKRGSNLVKQVLSFARGVDGSRVTVRLRDVVSELESIIQNTFPKDIALETKLADGPLQIEGDPTQINQVLLNLCVNARDAMPNGGKLVIAVTTTTIEAQYEVMQRGVSAGRYVCIEVADTGCGISQQNLPKIFDPFFTTKELTKGTGLGLATTLGIVRSHAGFINVYSEVGRGTSFKIYLPARLERADDKPEVIEKGDWPRGNGEWILLIDDEPAILTVTQQILEAFGYRVLTAEHGAQGLGIFAANREKIALVLTDMMMPVMDGASTILALREITPGIKIIAASGLNSSGNSEKAARVGVHHFLAKPYAAGVMLNMIQTLLKEGM